MTTTVARTEMSERPTCDLEALLSDALRPIEPPESLAGRVESTLTAITEQAAAELSSWAEELSRGRARGAPRPTQLGAPGRRGRRGHVAGGGARAWSARAAAASRPAFAPPPRTS